MNTLVFEGGGIKGLCYVGALEQLEEFGKIDLKNKVKFVGGTSAGSIVATLIASDHSVNDMKDIMFKLDWNKLKDGNGFVNFFRLFRKLGYHKGEALEQLIEELLFKKLRRRNLTFQQLYVITGKHLKMVGTNLTKGCAFYMDYQHTPDMTVARGVHISCCLPLLFEPVIHNGDYCIDGGVLNNLDTHMFDGVAEVEQIIAFDLQENKKEPDERSNNIAEYVMRIVRSIHSELNKVSTDDHNVIVLPINETHIDFTNFELTDMQKRYMLSVGRQAVREKTF
jgi:predicted acylesterase/phospholipase RssA